MQAVVPPPDGGYPGFTTAEGQNALSSLTSGAANTGVGWYSLFSNARWQLQHRHRRRGAPFQHRRRKHGIWRGDAVIQHHRRLATPPTERPPSQNNTTGDNNTASGFLALSSNTEGNLNTAEGGRALTFNTIGSRNTATGLGALSSNVEGNDNTAVGANALVFNVNGHNNTGLGRSAGSHIDGSGNVCIGRDRRRGWCR